MTDIVERLRTDGSGFYDPFSAIRLEAADKIVRLREQRAMIELEIVALEHAKHNLHSHIKRLEDINSGLERENAKLREALQSIVDYPDLAANAPHIARAALKDEGE